jgi:hypothetical protein
MRQRCAPEGKYRPLGITVCKRWDSFLNFLEDMGERPEGMTLDRIDNSKGYSPENCRWVTKQVQNANRGKRRPSSPETRQKISESVKKRRAESPELWANRWPKKGC